MAISTDLSSLTIALDKSIITRTSQLITLLFQVNNQNLQIPNAVDNNVEFSFMMNKPKLWWTWNLGKANLYTFKVTIIEIYADGGLDTHYLDEKTVKYGIRTINWI